MNATQAVERVVVMGGDTPGRLPGRDAPARSTGGPLRADIGVFGGCRCPWIGERAPGHDRGRLLAQVVVMLAGGGECVADLAALRDQPDLFGEVVSAPTVWRAVHEVDDVVERWFKELTDRRLRRGAFTVERHAGR